jgi:hypothetical protein
LLSGGNTLRRTTIVNRCGSKLRDSAQRDTRGELIVRDNVKVCAWVTIPGGCEMQVLINGEKDFEFRADSQPGRPDSRRPPRRNAGSGQPGQPQRLISALLATRDRAFMPK